MADQAKPTCSICRAEVAPPPLVCIDCKHHDEVVGEALAAEFDDAKQAGIKHCKQHPITIMIEGGNMTALALGKVLFKADIFTADGHAIFAHFLKTWCDAGVEGC